MPRSTPSRQATAGSQPPASLGSMRRLPLVRALPLSGRAPASLQCRRRSPNMPPTSTLERPGEVYRDQPVRRLRRADLGDAACRLGGHDRAASLRRPLRPAALRLAPLGLRVRHLHDRAVVDGAARRGALNSTMSDVKTKSKREVAEDSPAAVRAVQPPARDIPRRRLRSVPLLITLVTMAVAAALGWAMWEAYMGAPWTRDGTVRAYVVTMAPEVAGRIVELPVADNQFVHKGDLLMVIDPTNFKIAVSLAEAAVQQAQANAQNAEREAKRRQRLSDLAETVEDRQTFESNALVAQAQYQQAAANLDQARVNLERTQIRSPVNGWVTHLLAQLGDYANVGQNIMY